MEIDVCTLNSMANVRILDERRPTREKRKGDEVLCMTIPSCPGTDVSRIPTIPELERQISCFPYGARSDVPRLRKSNKKPSDGRGISDYAILHEELEPLGFRQFH